MPKKHGDATREEPLQAVLLADDVFGRSTLRPLSTASSNRPACLCPLHTVPLVDYALDFLAGAGVAQVFVVCVATAVADHVQAKYNHHMNSNHHTHHSNNDTNNHTNNHNTSNMTVTILQDASFLNAGDALRELDKRNCVKSDPFVLVHHADIVTNVDLTAALALQKERHSADSAALMTMLVRPHPQQRAPTVLGLDPQLLRVYLYQSLQSSTSAASNSASTSINVTLPCSFLATTPSVELRTDLEDCGIDICSPDLLARFSDNFDYGDIRQEFVANSVAEEEEGLQNVIHAYIVGEHDKLDKHNQRTYARRVTDPYSYHQISRDILQRWCHPLPSMDDSSSYYRRQRHYQYTAPTARVARTAAIAGPGLLGPDCVVGADSRIHQSCLGRQCRVGDRVVVEDSHLWDRVCVHDGATVRQSILAEGVCVHAGAVVQAGCVIGAGCVVGAGVVLPAGTRLSAQADDDDDDGFGDDDDWNNDNDSSDDDDDNNNNNNDSEKENDQPPLSDPDVVGPDGVGHVWRPPADDDEYPNDDDDDDDDTNKPFWTTAEKLAAESIGFDRHTLVSRRRQFFQEPADHWSDVEDLEGDDNDDFYGADDGVTFTDAPSSMDHIVGRQKGVDVLQELKAICMEFEITTTNKIENLAIELNSFKFSQNATYSDCVTAAIWAMLEQLPPQDIDVKIAADFKKSLVHWSPLLQKMCIGPPEERAIVVALEDCATAGHPQAPAAPWLAKGRTLRFLLTLLEDEEVVSDQVLLAWADERQAEPADTPRGRLFRLESVQEFLAWLRQEDSSDDDEEESDDDDESE